MFWRGPDTRHPKITPVGNFTTNNDLPPGAVNQSDYCPDCQTKLVTRKQDSAKFCGACGWGYPGDLEEPSLKHHQPSSLYSVRSLSLPIVLCFLIHLSHLQLMLPVQ